MSCDKSQEENEVAGSALLSDAYRGERGELRGVGRLRMKGEPVIPWTDAESDRSESIATNQLHASMWQGAYRDPRPQPADNSDRPCVECRHFIFGEFCRKVRGFDLVSGSFPQTCSLTRIHSDECGPSGRLFEERKPSIFKRLIKVGDSINGKPVQPQGKIYESLRVMSRFLLLPTFVALVGIAAHAESHGGGLFFWFVVGAGIVMASVASVECRSWE